MMAVTPPVRVIFITDGDDAARSAVERAAANLGLRCISASAGSPTPLTGEELVALIKQAAHDPVLVMFDDKGHPGRGRGEAAMRAVAAHPDIRVLGAIAVASDEWRATGIEVTCSVCRSGELVPGAVDKEGRPLPGRRLVGDTVDSLRRLGVPVVVGLGDVGKQRGADRAEEGARLTTTAIQAVLEHSQEIAAQTEGTQR